MDTDQIQLANSSHQITEYLPHTMASNITESIDQGLEQTSTQSLLSSVTHNSTTTADDVIPKLWSASLSSSWDPTVPNPNELSICAAVQRRLNAEMGQYYKDPPPGIYLSNDERNLSIFHSIVIGPSDTPYEGGFFYFILKIPSNYPWVPPLVKLMTTGDGKVRFNPNLYASGMVCLSLLGTWPGPSWSPGITLPGLLISVQSLMNSEPFYNEPGYEPPKEGGAPRSPQVIRLSNDYTEEIRFHTLRVAVLDMVEGLNSDTNNLPDYYKKKVETLFLEKYDEYRRIITTHLKSTKVDYRALLTRFVALKIKLESRDD